MEYFDALSNTHLQSGDCAYYTVVATMDFLHKKNFATCRTMALFYNNKEVMTTSCISNADELICNKHKQINIEQDCQLSLTNPRDALHHGKRATKQRWTLSIKNLRPN